MIIKCKRIVTEDGIVDGYLEIEGKKIKRLPSARSVRWM